MIMILKGLILFYMISNIINFKKIITNKKGVIQIVVLPILAFIFSFCLIEILLNQDIGLDCLIQEFFVIVTFIIMLLSLIIGLVKKSDNLEIHKSKKNSIKFIYINFTFNNSIKCIFN